MTGPNDRAGLLDIAEAAARAAGAELLRSFESELLGVQWKTWQGERTVVTDADFAADRAIRQVLAEQVPTHTVFSEEFPDDEEVDGPDVWVIDPLDGTDNYSRGQPQFCVSVAHTRHTRPDAAAIYDPGARRNVHGAGRRPGAAQRPVDRGDRKDQSVREHGGVGATRSRRGGRPSLQRGVGRGGSHVSPRAPNGIRRA